MSGAGVDGLADVFLALGRLERKLGTKIIRRALKSAAQPALDTAKALVPKGGDTDGDGYTLTKGLRLQSESARTRKRNGTIAQFRLGAGRQSNDGRGSAGYAIKGGLGKSAKAPNYAQLINRRTPFLLPALVRNEQQILAILARELHQAVMRP